MYFGSANDNERLKVAIEFYLFRSMRELYPKIQFTKNANKCAYRTKVENMEMSLKMLSRGLQLHKEGKFGDDKNFDFGMH